MLRLLLVSLLFLFAGLTNNVNAQISSSTSSGCAPLVGVSFTGVSGSTNILWDFDDGGSANILNPVHTFANPGTYDVHYTATVSGSPVSYFLTITVYGKPTPAFTSPGVLSGCVPLNVSFQSQSTGGGGSAITQYSWAFGDGGVSSVQNPSYNYTIPGQYTVTLVVTDANGCDSSISKPQLISVSQKPVPIVTSSPNPASACNPPLNVTFNGASSYSNSLSSPALTYAWSFGNGNTSTVASPPAQTYTASGSYTTWLVITDDNGCKDSVSRPVTIANPFASFQVADTVCQQITFIDTASSPGAYTWNYGDGNTGISNTHNYASSGTYQVTLTVTSGTCTDDTTREIFVETLNADFTLAPLYSCSDPHSVTATNTSVNGQTYVWSAISDDTAYTVTPDTSFLFNPVFLVENIDTNRYTINDFDTVLTVKLLVISAHGCRDSLIKALNDTVFLPTSRYQPNVTHGCFPLNVVFSDSSLSRENIVSWEYIFGDGSGAASPNGSATHTYSNPGIYYPLLVITNSSGCTDTSYAIPIYVGSPPVPDFSISTSTVCVHNPVTFTDLSTSTGNSPIDTWHYSTDNSFYMSSCYNEASPTWSFTSSTGVQDITLEVCSRGCCESVTVPNMINVLGPLAEFTARMDCDSSLVYQFIGNIQDATSWDWDFGDGNTLLNSTQQNVSHTYAASGDYLVSVIAFNSTSGCVPDTFKVPIYVKQIDAAFIAGDFGCARQNETFNATSSTDVYSNGNNGYVWLWGDGTPPTITGSPSVTHAFNPDGNYTVKLVVTDRNGCRDTALHTISVSDVQAEFSADNLFGCIPWTVNFSDNSSSDTTIINYAWDFGDGTTASGVPQSHQYTNNTLLNFTTQLIVTNALSCKDTFSLVLTPSKPKANFSASTSTQKCAGDSVRFTPLIGTHAGYDWDFGDGQTSTLMQPWHAYQNGGTYSVSLTVTDSIGCQATFTLNSLVKIQDKPQAGFSSTADGLAEKCYPLTVNFTDTSIASVFANRVWDLGNGSPVVPNVTVGTIYQLPGTYSVSLIVTTTFGCKDTVVKSLTVEGPVADFSLSPTTICKGQSVTFNIKDTTSVAFYQWDFGDGFDTSGVSPVTHTFNIHPLNGQANVTLVYWGPDSSCAQTKIYPVTIRQVIADFNRNGETAATDTAHCLGIKDILTNTSINATTYQWNLGDGTQSSVYDPQHTYTQAGTYTITLNIADSQTGCVDTIRKEMIIHPLPEALATGGDTCKNESVQLSASGGTTYQWTPQDGLNFSNIQNPIATPEQTTIYSVLVTDINNCSDSDTARVGIIQPPPSISWDTTIVIGQTVPLSYNIGDLSDYIFSWSPFDSLSCSDCPNPIYSGHTDKEFTLTVTDRKGCFNILSYYAIDVEPVSSLDVPSAFTPNGDGINDVVYVRGWGIKELLEFNIYNRWGELVFSTNDINVGWDGYYKGKLQNIETYAYTVKADTFVDGVREKKGFIKLLR